jgi:hypothetical protein
VGELPNSHGWTLTGKSYVLHGIPYYRCVEDHFEDFEKLTLMEFLGCSVLYVLISLGACYILISLILDLP